MGPGWIASLRSRWTTSWKRKPGVDLVGGRHLKGAGRREKAAQAANPGHLGRAEALGRSAFQII